MGRSQRTKGAAAERELAGLLRDRLGTAISRNLQQTRQGGHDLLGVGCFALECKRVERLTLSTWWAQTLRQAQMVGLRPALAYRQSRQPWLFLVLLGDINPELATAADLKATLDIEGFCQAVRHQNGKD